MQSISYIFITCYLLTSTHVGVCMSYWLGLGLNCCNILFDSRPGATRYTDGPRPWLAPTVACGSTVTQWCDGCSRWGHSVGFLCMRIFAVTLERQHCVSSWKARMVSDHYDFVGFFKSRIFIWFCTCDELFLLTM